MRHGPATLIGPLQTLWQKDLPDVWVVRKRRGNRAVLTFSGWALLALAGIFWSGEGRLSSLAFAQPAWPGSAVSSGSSKPSAESPMPQQLSRRGVGGSTRVEEQKPPPSNEEILTQDAWVHGVQPSHAIARQPSYRWRHAGLDVLLARPHSEGPDLHAALNHSSAVVATNAAIALARRGDPAGAEQLAAAVRADQARLPLRCAAAEALGGLKHELARLRVLELTDQFGRDPRDGNPAYLAELHAELVRAMVRQGARASDPRFVLAMRSPAPAVRLEAAQAWLFNPDGPLPAEAVDWRVDQDARVRSIALSILVRYRHPDARTFIQAGLTDQDYRVHATAIEELGRLPNGEGRELLRKLLKDPTEMVRAHAVTALVASGAGEDEVWPMVKDKSWRVRLAVAEALRHYPSRGGVAVAKLLLNDASPAVQEKVVAAMEAWGLPEAGPVLLEAMGKIVVVTRRTAARQLAARWAPAAEFSPDGAPERRSQLIESLRQRFRDQFGVEVGLARMPQAPVVTPEILARVEQLLAPLGADDKPTREAAARQLAALGPTAVEALQCLAIDRRLLLPEAVYAQVLPAVSPAFAVLERLRYEDVVLRRRAATELTALTADRPLSPLALERLASIVVREPDTLVWQGLLSAVGRDSREPAVRLAYVAIGHQSPEVRRRACEYLAAQPGPGHVPVLLPALEDPSEVVIQAAARALGFTGRVDDLGPLRRLLLATNDSIRLEAAIALTRLNDPSGSAALERLAYAPDPVIRREVAVAMGEMPDPAFTPTLIRLLDDQQAVRRAALQALPKVVGHDVAVPEGQTADDLSQRIELWKRWFQGERAARR